MKEKTVGVLTRLTDGVFVGLMVGAILSCIINLFIVYGGNPRGIYWKLEDAKNEAATDNKILKGKFERMERAFVIHKHNNNHKHRLFSGEMYGVKEQE